MKKSLYQILGVSETAKQVDLDNAYAVMRAKYQEMRDQGDPEASNQLLFLKDAHAILSDPIQRDNYDNKLLAALYQPKFQSTAEAPIHGFIHTTDKARQSSQSNEETASQKESNRLVGNRERPLHHNPNLPSQSTVAQSAAVDQVRQLSSVSKQPETNTKIRKTLYEIIGVLPTATRAEIEASFLKLSEQHKPENSIDNLEAYEQPWEIKKAYEILTNDSARLKYDSELNQLQAKHSSMPVKAQIFHLIAANPLRITALAVLTLGIIIALGVYAFSPRINVNCSVKSTARSSCVFENNSRFDGSACVRVILKRVKTNDYIVSSPVCAIVKAWSNQAVSEIYFYKQQGGRTLLAENFCAEPISSFNLEGCVLSVEKEWRWHR